MQKNQYKYRRENLSVSEPTKINFEKFNDEYGDKYLFEWLQ